MNLQKSHSLIVALLFVVTASSYAQKPLKQKHLDYLAEHDIELVDSSILYNQILKQNGKVKMVVIFTNYCVGTPMVFSDVKSYREQYGDKMEFVLCSSATHDDIDDLVKLIKEHQYEDKVYFIDPAKYKEYRFEDRKKGFLFRNDICIPCMKDVIGTPYRIFYGPDNNVLFYGYASRNNFDEMLSEYFSEHQ